MNLIVILKGLVSFVLLSLLTILSLTALQEKAAIDRVSALDTPALETITVQYVARHGASAPLKIRLAEALMQQSLEHDELALEALKSALESDSERPFALALSSFAETRRSGRFNAQAEAYLRQSIEVCPFCNRDLLKWRLEFVLANWDQVPDDIKDRVFEGADFLRWWHLEYAYLRQLGDAAEQEGIPFTFYQKQVDTPVRPNELGR